MKRKKLEKKSLLKAVIALAVALAFVIPGAAAFANVGTFGVTTNLENTDTINNIVEDEEGPIDKREVTSDTSDVVEDAVLGSGGNTIYVGGSGPDNSTTIQEGITLAEAGDTVYVYNGIYYENLTVDKSINLIGESKEGTIIDGSNGTGKILYVIVDSVNVSSNNFVNNGINDAYHTGGGYTAIWDNGYPSGGNYYSDYIGEDILSGPNQDTPGSDGIGDTAYEIPGDDFHKNWDYYPLMHPWGTPPEITNVTATPSPQSIGVNITCTVEDIHNGVKPAIVYITDPNSDQQGFEMTGINVDYLGNGEYYYNATYSIIGIYNYFIRAENLRDCGNESGVYQFEIITGSDTVPPVTNCTLMGTVGENDWYVSDVEVNLTVTDPPPSSGINYTMYKLDETNWTEYTNPFTVTTDGTHTVEYYSIDMAGNNESEPNWENLKSTSFKIDQTAPETSCELDPPEPDGENDWYVSDVEVTLTATDDTSGINYTMYNLDETGWTEYDSITVTTDGYHTVEYNSTDNAGNTESTKSVDFEIDQTAPETSCELDPPEPDGENDWYVSDVEVTLTATDDTSGVNYTMYKLDENDWTKYMNPFTVTTDEYHTVKYYSVDMAGNIESTKPVSFKIDQTNPMINLTVETDLTKWLLTAEVFDKTSDVAKVEFYVNSVLAGTVTTAPYKWEGSEKGTAYAIVFDNAGNDARSVEKATVKARAAVQLQFRESFFLTQNQLLIQSWKT